MSKRILLITCAALGAFFLASAKKSSLRANEGLSPGDPLIDANAARMVAGGRRIFRFDTFGDESF
jgi:hypothetical protein